jgi:N-acetylglucosaminyldiphosphoundecaprenol N-acetyl-beta-D-mannosaminyltransferase
MPCCLEMRRRVINVSKPSETNPVASGTTTGSERVLYPPVSLMGLEVNPISDAGVVSLVSDAIRNRYHIVVANHNLHSVYLWHREERMRLFYANADYTQIDGMALILLARFLGMPLKRADRAAVLDFFPLLASMAVEQGWRIFYVGSRLGVAALGATLARQEYPGLNIRTHHGYLDADENKKVIAEINAYQPQILMVGMGMPKQEYWILENRDRIEANVIFPVGAFMDYRAGKIPTAPRWLASLYLEWAYRLLSEPRRLRRRYLVEPWYVVGQVMRHCYLQKKFAPANKQVLR